MRLSIVPSNTIKVLFCLVFLAMDVPFQSVSAQVTTIPTNVGTPRLRRRNLHQYFNSTFDNSTDHRSLSETVSTSACPKLRSYAYDARLDVYYFYRIDFVGDIQPPLDQVERAVAHLLSERLNECDPGGQPRFAVRVSDGSAHHPAASSECVSTSDENGCAIIRGLTSILFDNGSSNLAEVAYGLVEQVLEDVDSLNSFLFTPLLGLRVLGHIGDSIVLPDGTFATPTPAMGLSPSVKILMVIIVTLFAVLTIFLYGVYRNREKLESFNYSRRRLAYLQAKRQRYWHELEEGNVSPSIISIHNRPVQTVTWSVSDLTSESDRASARVDVGHTGDNRLDANSDSESIMSNLKMDRIEEVDEHSDEDHVEDDEVASADPAPRATPGKPPTALIECVPHVRRSHVESVTTRLCLDSPSHSRQFYAVDSPTPVVPVSAVPQFYPSRVDSPSQAVLPHLGFLAQWHESGRAEEEAENCGLASIAFTKAFGGVWREASMPPSFFDESDPEADTPVKSNKSESFDGLLSPSGIRFLDENSELDQDDGADPFLNQIMTIRDMTDTDFTLSDSSYVAIDRRRNWRDSTETDLTLSDSSHVATDYAEDTPLSSYIGGFAQFIQFRPSLDKSENSASRDSDSPNHVIVVSEPEPENQEENLPRVNGNTISPDVFDYRGKELHDRSDDFQISAKNISTPLVYDVSSCGDECPAVSEDAACVSLELAEEVQPVPSETPVSFSEKDVSEYFTPHTFATLGEDKDESLADRGLDSYRDALGCFPSSLSMENLWVDQDVPRESLLGPRLSLPRTLNLKPSKKRVLGELHSGVENRRRKTTRRSLDKENMAANKFNIVERGNRRTRTNLKTQTDINTKGLETEIELKNVGKQAVDDVFLRAWAKQVLEDLESSPKTKLLCWYAETPTAVEV